MNSLRRSCCLIFWVACGLLAPALSLGQVPLLPSNDDKATTAASAELAELEKRKAQLRERLAEWQSMADEYARTGQEAQARIERLDQEIALLERREEISIPEGLSTSELDARILDAEQDLNAARAEAAELDARIRQRTDRRRRLPELMLIAKQRLSELEKSTASTTREPASGPLLSEIEELRREVLRAEIEAYQAELSSYDVRGTLLSKQQDRATLRIAYYETLSRQLREAKQRLAQLAVEEETRSTEELLAELTSVPPSVKQTLEELHARNESLASLWTSDGGLSDQIEDVSVKLSRAERRVAEVKTELTRLAARVDAVGLADSVGALLRRHRRRGYGLSQRARLGRASEAASRPVVPTLRDAASVYGRAHQSVRDLFREAR
jgi:DNA repair exonuclease SbcCD ATPase subunit